MVSQAPSASAKGSRIAGKILMDGKLPAVGYGSGSDGPFQIDRPGFADQPQPIAADLLGADVATEQDVSLALEAHRRLRAGHQGLWNGRDRQMVAVELVFAAHRVAAELGAHHLVAEPDIIVADRGRRPAVDRDH